MLRNFLHQLLCVNNVTIKRNCQLDAVCFSRHGLRALHYGVVVAFSRGGVSDVADADVAWQASKPFLKGAGLQLRYQVKVFVNVKFFVIVCEKSV
jgi:hypothetical protein